MKRSNCRQADDARLKIRLMKADNNAESVKQTLSGALLSKSTADAGGATSERHYTRILDLRLLRSHPTAGLR